jgi:geranylgeranyl reductase family protein
LKKRCDDGIAVLLLEKRKLPRYKCCAGGVTLRARRLLDFDISEVVEDVVDELSIAHNLGSAHLGRHVGPLIYMVMRDRFDNLLARQARDAGAVVMDEQEVKQIQVSAEGVDVSTVDSAFCARILAGADGAYGVVARKLSMGRAADYAVAMEAELVVPDEEVARWRSRVGLDLGCLPGCHGWVFPKRRHLSVGAMCAASRASDLKRCYHKFLGSLGIGDYTTTRVGGHLIPTCHRGALFYRDNALLLGDAAGLADPLTGEGIHNAILSARLAAPVIRSSLGSGRIELSEYQQAVEDRIVAELARARTLSRILGRLPHLAVRMLDSDLRVWQAGFGLLRGELDYATIVKKLGGFRAVFDFLSRV